jgi:predicted acetyltransferase
MLTRRLEVADLAAASVLATEAFGGPAPGQQPRPVQTALPPGRSDWGAFDGDRMVAKVAWLSHHAWFGGARLASCGVAGVAVEAEHRGAGLLAPLLAEAVAEAVGQGALVSGMYPTAPGIYRSLGWELVTSLDTITVPTAELARLRTPEGITTRRAVAADLPAIHATYDAWAAAHNGPLTRTGPCFRERDLLLEQVTGVSLAIDADGEVVGYASWDRGHGYGPAGSLTVLDLVATDLDAYRALWTLLGTSASVTGTVRVRTSGDDAARLVLPAVTWDVVQRHAHAWRVLDLPGVVEAVQPRLPADARAEVDLVVVGDRLGLVDGGHRLSVGERTTCLPAETSYGATRLSIQGLGLLVSGARPTTELRLLGHLHDGSPADDLVLDALFGGRRVHVRDYF